MSALHEQAVLAVADPEAFGVVRSAVDTAFSAGMLKNFLQRVDHAGLRIRDFDAVLLKGLLGASTPVVYGSLTDGDKGQIREFYLAALEKVSPELRTRFYRLYAYY